LLFLPAVAPLPLYCCPWMKDEKTFIACCTDGVKPVILKLERIEG
jgi:uncharacterized repeat protein (TIGR04076 family)